MGERLCRSMFEEQGHDPLASRLRPDTLEGYVGQTHLLGGKEKYCGN